jgi:hypothetical protein
MSRRPPSRTGKLQPGSWRSTARRIIQAHVQKYTELHGDPATLFQTINKKHYPFGMRKYLPYKSWLTELALARESFAIVSHRAGTEVSPGERYCNTCGANPGKPCRVLDDRDPNDPLVIVRQIAEDAEAAGRLLEATAIRQQAYHESRLAKARVTPVGSGPLFGEP